MNPVPETVVRLQELGIQASAQRVAIARYVLTTDAHPSAETVWQKVRQTFPHVSRATVYNTLNLFVSKGLLRQFTLEDGTTVFDPHVDRHHHFIDEQTGKIHDLPWDSLQVADVEHLAGYEVREYMVILRGRKRPPEE